MLSIHQKSTQKWNFSNQNCSRSSSSLQPKSRSLISPINSSASTGEVKRLVLTQEGRTKLNLSPDREFYAYPRFVTHVDDNFISNLRNLYGEILRPEMEILDLCSSWVSHLPKQVAYKKVVGHGLNAQELARNPTPRLDYFFVKDLNKDQKLRASMLFCAQLVCSICSSLKWYFLNEL